VNLFTQAIYSGLTSGAVYALLAMGLVIAYRTTRVVNLAHGESYAIAGIVIGLLDRSGVPLGLALPAGVLAAMLFLWGMDRLLLRPRSAWPIGSLILVTLGVAFLARGVFMVAAGVDPLSFPRLIAGPPLRFAGGVIPRQAVTLIGVAVVAAAGVALFLARTRFGRQLRATAEHPDAAQLMGEIVYRPGGGASRLGGGGGGLAAALLVPLVPVDFQTGLGMTLRGFIAAALAGMVPGAAVFCGFLLGLFEAFVTSYGGALASDPVVFLVLIVAALWRSRSIRFDGGARA
jgi:branched-subunit amino acid ABC-type transport system permease component